MGADAMRILVVGANGQLGSELCRVLAVGESQIGPIPVAYAGAEVLRADRDVMDITAPASVEWFFSVIGSVDLVINCAAMTNVDGCEANEDAAFAVNARGVESLARACATHGAALVHISTDYVFPGTEPGERVEADKPAPISAYGRSKLEGERLALAANPNTYVVRTAWLYGRTGKNFVKTMLRLARQRGGISVVDDQLGNPTCANDLAYEILRIAQTGEYGIWHCTGEGTCSWFDFASAIVELAGVPCEREPLSSEEYKRRFPASASRPKFSSLRNARLEATVGNEMRPWRGALEAFLPYVMNEQA